MLRDDGAASSCCGAMAECRSGSRSTPRRRYDNVRSCVHRSSDCCDPVGVTDQDTAEFERLLRHGCTLCGTVGKTKRSVQVPVLRHIVRDSVWLGYAAAAPKLGPLTARHLSGSSKGEDAPARHTSLTIRKLTEM